MTHDRKDVNQKKVSDVYGNKALKAAREQSGKTQADVARETALNVRMYQRYETGTGNNTIRAAIRIARSLGSTVEKLWGENVEKTSANPV